MDSSHKHDKLNPWLRANIISRTLFWWLKDLFLLGYRKDLQEEDLYNTLPQDKSETLGDQLESNWVKEIHGGSPSLFNALVKTFWRTVLDSGIWFLLYNSLFRVGQALFLSQLIDSFIQNGTGTGTSWYRSWYAVGMLSCSFLCVVSHTHALATGKESGMKIRVACCSLLYRKMLRLSRCSTGGGAAGQVVNLMSNDVNRFDEAGFLFNSLWITPVQVLVITGCVWRLVGVSAIIGVCALVLMTVPVQMYIGRLAARYRLRVAERTDRRVLLLSEIVAGIRLVKMYAWEKPFHKMLQLVRKVELGAIRRASHLRGYKMAGLLFTDRIALLLTLAPYVLLGHRITAAQVYAVCEMYNALKLLLAFYFPCAIDIAGECKVSVARIQKFLLQDEIDVKAPCTNTNSDEEYEKREVAMCDVKAGWFPNANTTTLANITLNIKPGMFCAVVGPVGSGKSSLLQALMGELAMRGGAVFVGGRLSYAAQEPWLFPGTVRANILFGQRHEERRYREVVRACALERDLQLLPCGDGALVGGQGVGLSGGQRARINLARAVYREADVYLLDSPLAAVDSRVGRQLYDQCVRTFLAGKTRILVTHQPQFLRDADLIVVLNNGRIENMGTFHTLAANNVSFTQPTDQTDDIIPTHGRTGTVPEESDKAEESKNQECGNHGDEEGEEDAAETAELLARGRVKKRVYYRYFLAGSGACRLALLLAALTVAQVAVCSADWWIAHWTNQEQLRNHYVKVSLGARVYNNTTSESIFRAGTILDTLDIKDILNNLKHATVSPDHHHTLLPSLHGWNNTSELNTPTTENIINYTNTTTKSNETLKYVTGQNTGHKESTESTLFTTEYQQLIKTPSEQKLTTQQQIMNNTKPTTEIISTLADYSQLINNNLSTDNVIKYTKELIFNTAIPPEYNSVTENVVESTNKNIPQNISQESSQQITTTNLPTTFSNKSQNVDNTNGSIHHHISKRETQVNTTTQKVQLQDKLNETDESVQSKVINTPNSNLTSTTNTSLSHIIVSETQNINSIKQETNLPVDKINLSEAAVNRTGDKYNNHTLEDKDHAVNTTQNIVNQTTINNETERTNQNFSIKATQQSNQHLNSIVNSTQQTDYNSSTQHNLIQKEISSRKLNTSETNVDIIQPLSSTTIKTHNLYNSSVHLTTSNTNISSIENYNISSTEKVLTNQYFNSTKHSAQQIYSNTTTRQNLPNTVTSLTKLNSSETNEDMNQPLSSIIMKSNNISNSSVHLRIINNISSTEDYNISTTEISFIKVVTNSHLTSNISVTQNAMDNPMDTRILNQNNISMKQVVPNTSSQHSEFIDKSFHHFNVTRIRNLPEIPEVAVILREVNSYPVNVNSTLSGQEALLSSETCLWIYAALVAGCVSLVIFRTMFFMDVCVRSSKGLHNKMFSSVLGTSMRFFDINPPGRILNRFSKDLGTVDEMMPPTILMTVQIVFVGAGILVLVAIQNTLALIPFLIAALLVWKLCQIYLATAEDIKRLEGVTRSPVFSHVTATLDGLTTIRASGAQDLVKQEFDSLQDQHTAAWSLTISTGAFLSLWTDCLTSSFMACVTAIFVAHADDLPAGAVGLALSQTLVVLGMVCVGVTAATTVANHMVSVERLLQFSELPPESGSEPGTGLRPPGGWPALGGIVFQGLDFSYSTTGPLVLRDINLAIRPGEKVGIVGRTGAGKTSVAAALFRLAWARGTVRIDGVDTGQLALRDLRHNICIIPQEPVLFSAPLRVNLDPTGTLPDLELWEALAEVELKEVISSLDSTVHEGGSNLSLGQRQLLCLARAVIRNNRILVLDEATANVDPQ